MLWAYGVTTTFSRRLDLLPRTLKSLAAAGFDKPHLFVDGVGVHGLSDYADFSLPITPHYDPIRIFGNFYLGLAELLIRYPDANRYAMFQDDLVICRNTRAYLEKTEDVNGYWNLYTFPCNLARCGAYIGWSHSDQKGRGAVALVFPRAVAMDLVCSKYMMQRPENQDMGWKNLDGGIVSALTLLGYKEYVHNPSLVQHTGDVTTLGNGTHEKANSFRGEDYDALEIKPCPA